MREIPARDGAHLASRKHQPLGHQHFPFGKTVELILTVCQCENAGFLVFFFFNIKTGTPPREIIRAENVSLLKRASLK